MAIGQITNYDSQPVAGHHRVWWMLKISYLHARRTRACSRTQHPLQPAALVFVSYGLYWFEFEFIVRGATKPNCQACRGVGFTMQCLTKTIKVVGTKFSSITEGLSGEVLTALSLLQSSLLKILATVYKGEPVFIR